MNIENARRQFLFEGDFREAVELKSGLINNTFHLSFDVPGGRREYILQELNTNVFKKPYEVTENARRVTEFLAAAYEALGVEHSRRVLRLIPTRDSGFLHIDADGMCWRAYEYVTGATAHDRPENLNQFREAGRGFGTFQRMLADYPVSELYVTIPGFHDTRARFDMFETSVRADMAKRAESAEEEIAFLRSRRARLCEIMDALDAGEIPLRVTHNDTKINNVMLDDNTGEALCVIDLDTIMPGTLLWDFGDAIRFGASTAAEDEPDTSKIGLDMNLFRAFAEGFLSEVGHSITPREAELLPCSVEVMTGELAMRFLTDYLDGDTYFKVKDAEHNLVRARAQIALLRAVEAKRDEMAACVADILRK